MLQVVNRFSQLDFFALMDVYQEGNAENAEDLWPDLPEGQRLLQAEQEFCAYLKDVFFTTEGAVYCVWLYENTYASALRLEPYKDGWLLEALETHPDLRRRGFAKQLISSVQTLGNFDVIYAHVHKRNVPSLAAHRACGFQRIREMAVYIDGSVNHNACTMRWIGNT